MGNFVEVIWISTQNLQLQTSN